ncbi:MAG TPA: fused MFS/spermidine synthase [Candidatus Saccharimonadales bacterium]|nr:fused MFS/spermidine synthase [Candidatus Saccharimonadales bacterium]
MADTLVYEGSTEIQHYQVVDTIYEGRPARVLFSGQRGAAQSGIATDDNPDLLFDYNQRYLELIESRMPRRVLLIGGGAYTLPSALLKLFPSLHIDVVELDPGLDDIARRFFGLQSDPRLRIFHSDGRYYLEQSHNTYDAILIDAFTHTTVPSALRDAEVPALVSKRLTAHGVVAMNVISPFMGPNAGLIRELTAYYQSVFPSVAIHPAGRTLFTLQLPQNLLLIASKDKGDSFQLRYGALDQPAP